MRRLAREIDAELVARDGATSEPGELLRVLGELSPASGPDPVHVRLRHAGAHRREIELFAFVGQGRNDAEIARIPQMSPRTA